MNKATLTCLASAAFLSMMGAAHADEDNVKPAASPAEPVASAGSSATVAGAHVDLAALMEETRIDAATFYREDIGDRARLDVKMHVDLCSGAGCQKKFQLHIACLDEHGYFAVINSGWYRNYVTQGDATQTYTFEDPLVPYCEKVVGMDVTFKYGWEGTSG